ncbi:36133_t:CDS:2, partial [Racocetra persica]
VTMEANDKRSLSINEKSVEGDVNVIDNVDGKIHDPEKIYEKKLDEDSQTLMISAAVSTSDNPTLPCITFRFWVLSS